MADVTVRPARTDDVDDILRIADAGWRTAYDDILAEETIDTAMDEWYDRDATLDLIENDAVGYFVAEAVQNGEAVGYVSGGPSDEAGVATLGAIYVEPDRWSEGIGSELLERFEEVCRERGLSTVEFNVLADNDVGRSFYRSHGYEAVEESETELFGETVRECTFRAEIE